MYQDHELDVDVAVIGGGQAGLATAYQLGRRGVDHVVLDAAPHTGHSWRTRWDSLRLFTPAAYSSLPGMPFPGPGDHHPSKDEVADYLCRYARTFDLPIRHDTAVTSVRSDGGAFAVEAPGLAVTAREVVVATGPFQTPATPAMARGLHPDVLQLHSSQYRRPSQLPNGGTVVVVGGGNSGAQIAAELASTCDVHLATGSEARFVPQHLLGRDLFWWLTRTGMLTAGPETRRGRRMQRTELVIGTDLRELCRSVTMRPRVIETVGSTVRFEDRSCITADAVVWATGFRSSHRFIEIPGALDGRGLIDQECGVGAVPGLYTVGQPWQRNRASSLLGFVGQDAALIAERIALSGRSAGRPSSTGTAPRQAVLAR